MLPRLSLSGTSKFLGCALLILAALAIGLASASAQGSEARIPFETRTSAAFASAIDAGPLPASQRLTLTLTFAPDPARAAALDQYLVALTTPAAPGFHQWLTPAEFAARFGAPSAQVDAATLWAQSQGLTVESVAPSAGRITVSGFAGQIQPAFAVALHAYRVNGAARFANLNQPSLPPEAAALFSAIDGLDDLPANSALTLNAAPATFASLARTVDANATPILALSSGLCSESLASSQRAEYTALFRQASAQGITILASSTCPTTAFPAALAEVTAVALPGDAAETGTPLVARPTWQSAPGLPADQLRHAPDLTASSVNALAQTLSSIAGAESSHRLGNVNPVLYELGPTPGLYTQADSAPAGTWEAASGLGLVDLARLAEVYPRGTGTSYTSFGSTNYAPYHGQSITLTSSVTSGTGGGTPTGTVSFETSTGTTLATIALVNGSASYTTNSLPGGSYVVNANYSGDNTYAPSSSPTGTILVKPESSQLSATVSSPTTIGSNFTVVVNDTSASGVGVPTGTVTVNISGTSTNVTATLAQSGANVSSATISVPATTVGTLTLSINCSGDASFSCDNPFTTTVTISKATPVLNLSYSPNPPVSGGSITLTASLAPVGNAPVPTGGVVFYDNTTVLNAGNLANGTVTVTGTVPSTATHSITATYNGDPNYNPVSSSPSSTGGTATATVLTTSSATPTYGQSVTLSATVSPASGSTVPAGTVTFTDSVSGQLGQATLVNGVAALATAALPAGSSTVVASYAGGGAFNPSSSAAVSETVAPEPVTLTVSVPANATADSTIGVTVTVTGSNTGSVAYPTGTVTVVPSGSGYSGSYTAGVTSGGGDSGSGTAQIQATAAGSVTFTATYSGDRNYASAGPATTTATIAKAASAVTLSFSPNPVVAGQPTTFTARVAFAGPTGPTGTVSFLVDGASIGTAALDSTGTAVFTTTLSAGNHVVSAAYSGDAIYAAGTSASLNTSTGTTATKTTLTGPTSPVAVGQSVTFTIAVAPATQVNNMQPSGTVQLLDAGTVIGSGVLSGGSVTISKSFSSNGVQTLTAFYPGDANYAASTSSPLAVSVGLVSTTTAVSLSSYSVAAGQNVTFTATVTPSGTVNSTTPTGSVTFSAATQGVLAANVPLVNGVATFTPSTPLANGVYNVIAAYSGDSNYAASTGAAPSALTVGAMAKIATTTILTLNPPAPLAGQPLVLTATITPASTGAAPISGTVNFYDGTGLLGSGAVVNGVASATATLTNSVLQSLTAVYSGDANYAGSTSIAVAVTPSLAPVTVTLTASNANGSAGSSVTFTAKVAGTSGASPTGTVSFYVSGSAPELLGSATLTVAGSGVSIATFSTSSIPAGAQTVYAVYSGDGNFATGTSSTISVGLSDYAITFTPAKITLTAGQTGTVTLQVTTAGAFTGTVAVTCTPPANAAITCALGQSSLSAGGTTTLTIATTALKTSALQMPSLKPAAGVSLAALLCWLLPGGRRRRMATLLLVLLVVGLSANLGCSGSTSGQPIGSGTPLGTVNLTIDSAGISANGVPTVNHDYSYQVTVQ